MTTYFVTRHSGAVEWARQQGISARVISHLDPETIQNGDTVLGTLPVSTAAEICAKGARYFHLSLQVPEDLRGQELSAQDMLNSNAHFQEYKICKP
jgi:CRISPR-associated protein Csx16